MIPILLQASNVTSGNITYPAVVHFMLAAFIFMGYPIPIRIGINRFKHTTVKNKLLSALD